jgi:hypothetical protein
MPHNLFLSGRNLILLFAALLSVVFRGSAAEIESSAPATTNQPAMSVDVRANVEGSFMPYRYAFITVGSAKYTFLVPDRYRVDASDPRKVKLISPDCSCFIVVGISNEESVAGPKTAETLREHVREHYLNAEFLGDQVVCANGRCVPGVDFNWKADKEIARSTRTAFFPTATGNLEFTLTTSPENFQAGLNELNLVMLTFRTGVDGRFDYVIGSNKP